MPRDLLVEHAPETPASGDSPYRGPVYRNKVAKDGFVTLEFSSLYEMFEASVKKFADLDCLGRREKTPDGVGAFKFWTYKETQEKVAGLASGVYSLGVQPKTRVGVFGANSPEWMVAMQAVNRMSMECVPLYDTLGENAIEYIINHAGLEVAFCSSEKLPHLVKALDAVKDNLKYIVYWGSVNEASAQAAQEKGLKVFTFDSLLEAGIKAPVEAIPPAATDIATIMYTSGTTGDPKGVILTHSAILSSVAALEAYCKQNSLEFAAGSRLLSYLPLAHIFDRVTEEWWLYIGGSIGYWQGEILKLVDDIGALKPHLFIGVPRVFDRIYNRVMGQLKDAGFLKKTLFNWGFNRKWHNLQHGYSHTQAAPFFDKLVFSKVKQRLGGEVKALISGGAPLAPHVEEFLKVTMCAYVAQGFGLTETCAASFIAALDDPAGHSTVGYPLGGTEFCLESVPDMGYDASDKVAPKGELLLRSSQMFSGYYKQEDKTAEVLEKDGWFHTGDIVVITEGGALKIIDRKKNIFKLSQGEYVAAEKVEAVYKKNLAVEQVWVYGNSFKSCLVAIVVPAKENLEAWAKTAGVAGTYSELCKTKEANAYILQELQTIGRAEKLKGFEVVKAVHLDSEQFSVENDLITPTFKLKRAPLQKKYQSVIDGLYKAVGE